MAEVLHELPDHAEVPEDLGDGEDEVGRRRPLGELAAEPEADDLRHEHGDGLAEEHGLGLDAADAPAEDAQAVDHRRVRVGADQRVGNANGRPPSSRVSTTRARYSRFTWWTIPVLGGTTLKLSKALWPHRRKA